MAKNKKNKKKLRTQFRKNNQVRTREGDLTRQYDEHGFEQDDAPRQQRVSGKGELTRQRTVAGAEVVEDETGQVILPDIDESQCLAGRVLSIRGLHSDVLAEGQIYQCATRRLLKSLSTDQRHVVAVGDRVMIRPADPREQDPQTPPTPDSQPPTPKEAIIERVEPRRGVLARTSKGRQHIMVANVDQLLILASAAEPRLKPNLIDRMLVMAEKSGIRPVICINKIDLINPADLMPLVGVYSQMGYLVVLTSVVTGFGIDRVREILQGQATAVAGQSGVGKSSLLNALDEDLGLRVSHVSEETQKGRHTTTNAQLIPLTSGSSSLKPQASSLTSFVVDTPGIRQFQLWDVIPEEVIGYYRDLRPYDSLCRFPNCTHTHEEDCAVKNAVADGRLDVRRYESYCHLREEG